ncbi:MAG: thioredoxin domain-containing protein [Methylobacteriaceae bacterium]|nr:thioredoxin domain-containing protein [Rhodoblastus sp.]MCC0004420.1 thioredoxin domain-containing protein [Methylobacteriaceae bacterium]
MTEPFFLSRRLLLASAAASASLAFAPGAAFALDGKVDVKELMAPDALPDSWVGKADAPVTIVEYASMTCSHCAAFHNETFPLLKKNYLDTGKARFTLREFPLDALAAAAFMLARFAGDKREALVDLLFAQQKNWAFVDKPLDALENTVKQAGIGTEDFKKCLQDKTLYENVLKVRQRAADKFGVNSTPTFFINGERKNGEIAPGDLDKLLAPFVDKK